MEHGHTEEMLKHIKIYIFIFLSLAVLTLVTVWASHLQVSHTMHIIIALAIASFKAALVALFFMHIRHSTKLTKLVVVGGLLWLAILLLMTMTDFLTRTWLGVPGR